MKNTRTMLCAAMMAAIPMLTMTLAAAPAQAQQYSRDSTGPSIRGFNVDEVRRLQPGAELNFDLYGTPGGVATLRIEGANRNLTLSETEPGQYEGVYIIGTRDHISASSAVTANLRVGNRVTTGVLSESLQRGVGSRDDRRRGEMADLPRVETFTVDGSNDLGPGNDLTFTVRGTPGAKVDIAITGARGVFFLPEVRPGEYSGVYSIRRSDHIAPNAAVTATIRANGRYTTAALGRPLLIAGGHRSEAPRVARYCTNCATVEAVNVVQVNGDGNYLGTLGGAVVGGLLGNQVGGGSGRTAAQVAGAVGGAVVGRNIERNSRAGQHYEVVVRYANGGTQAISYANDPGFQVGEKVKVNNGVVVLDR